MRRNIIVLIGILLLAGIQTVNAQQVQIDINQMLEQVKQVLPQDDYARFEEAVQKLYFDEGATVQKPAGLLDDLIGVIIEHIPFVVAAYLFDWVDPYIYIWNSDDGQYEIWPSCEMIDLPPWYGFWVRANRDVELKIRPWYDVDAPNVGDTMALTLQDDTYYFIAPPLSPSSPDIGVNFGDDFGMDSFEQTARISKWNHVSGQYDRYVPNSTFPNLLSGRGYWAYHIQNEPKTIDITGTKFSTNANRNSCIRSLPAGDHMCGNPFHFDMSLAMLFVKPVNSSSHEIAKIAVTDGESLLGSLESWHVDLKLTSQDGKYIDTYNRAGVIEAGQDIHEKLSAIDMPAIGDNIRLSILNDESDTGRYAFDIRSPGADEYVWNMELTTTLDQAAATLSLENIVAVPEAYALTLVDRNGVETPIGADASITVNLSAGEPLSYQLKAVRTTPTLVDEVVIPDAVSITGVSPNPFNPSTAISFDLDAAGAVAVKVFNINGQLVATLVDGAMQAGSHTLTWNAAGQSSGVYLITVSAHGFSDYRKVTLLK